jgi:hypothetical protein
MKSIYNKFFVFALSVCAGLVMSGCSDDDVPDPGIGNTKSGITAVVNGADWASSQGNFKLGTKTVTNGASAFVGAGDTLTIIGVQVQGTDTTAIVLSVKLNSDKVGSYKLRSGATGDGKAYFLTDFSEAALQETKEKYDIGITNGELRISEYDAANYSISGDFGFSMAATGETTYTIIAGKIENVTF